VLIGCCSPHFVKDVVVEFIHGDATITIPIGVSGLKASDHGLGEDGPFHQTRTFTALKLVAFERVLHRVRRRQPQPSTPKVQMILDADVVTRLSLGSRSEGTAVATVEHDDDAPGTTPADLFAY
jgi:hypothetical protein